MLSLGAPDPAGVTAQPGDASSAVRPRDTPATIARSAAMPAQASSPGPSNTSASGPSNPASREHPEGAGVVRPRRARSRPAVTWHLAWQVSANGAIRARSSYFVGPDQLPRSMSRPTSPLRLVEEPQHRLRPGEQLVPVLGDDADAGRARSASRRNRAALARIAAASRRLPPADHAGCGSRRAPLHPRSSPGPSLDLVAGVGAAEVARVEQERVEPDPGVRERAAEVGEVAAVPGRQLEVAHLHGAVPAQRQLRRSRSSSSPSPRCGAMPPGQGNAPSATGVPGRAGGTRTGRRRSARGSSYRPNLGPVTDTATRSSASPTPSASAGAPFR